MPRLGCMPREPRLQPNALQTPLQHFCPPPFHLLDNMEALVAVGLAGNVVQFVQFFGQLVSLANEIKRKGAPSSLLDLRKVAQDLAQQTRVIVTRLKANAATLEHEEQVCRARIILDGLDK